MLVLTSPTFIKEVSEFLESYRQNQAQRQWMRGEVIPYYIDIIEMMHKDKKYESKLWELHSELKKIGGEDESN